MKNINSTKGTQIMQALLFIFTAILPTIAKQNVPVAQRCTAKITDIPGQELFYPKTNNSAQTFRKSLYWDWTKIDPQSMTPEAIAQTFKERRKKIKNNDTEFLIGGAISAHQAEGNCTNNTYYLWEKAKKDDPACPSIQEESGIACDHWNRYKEDLDLVKNANLNTLRISVEWSKVQPRKPTQDDDGFDYAVLQHYDDLCEQAAQRGIKVVVTLHHYTDPIWFALEGGFEEQKNIHYFATFCSRVFEALNDKVHLWFTFNSPSGYSSRIYLTNVAPPSSFKKLDKKLVKNYKETNDKNFLIEALKKYKPKAKDMVTATSVLKNVALAHVQAYKAIKQCIGGQDSKIGILKNIHQVDPWNPANLLDKLTAFVPNELNDESLFNFFTTGTFRVRIPIPWFGKWVNTSYHHPDATKSLDFIGLNYYSHRFMHNVEKKMYPGEKMTGNENYTVYPEGLYRAIDTIYKRVAQPFDIPIYITENGIATDDDELRNEFLQKYTLVIAKAIEDGYPINGYIHWSLLDNFEWGNYNKHYGIYKVDFDTMERTLKPGSQHLVDLAKETFAA